MTPTGRGAGEAGRHTLVISAVLPELAAGSVISHSSAVCCTARIKYGRLLRPGQEPGDVVFDEKLREDRLRDAGLSVVRWIGDDPRAFDPVAARLRRSFRRR